MVFTCQDVNVNHTGGERGVKGKRIESGWRVSKRWVSDDALGSAEEAIYSWHTKHVRHHTANQLSHRHITKDGTVNNVMGQFKHKRKRKSHSHKKKHHKKHLPEHNRVPVEQNKQLRTYSHQTNLESHKHRFQKHRKHHHGLLETTQSPIFYLRSHNSLFVSENNNNSIESVTSMSGPDHLKEDVMEDHKDILSLHSPPVFDKTLPAKVRAQLGTHAYLPCRIIHLGDKSVSWVRIIDSHILTVDRYTFISDSRFTARFDVSSQTWTLQIKFVNDEDAGTYECQVSTEPKISRSIHLSIVRPVVTIPGGSELHVRTGSDVTIKCVISRAIEPPSYVFWYHEGSQMLTEGRAVERVTGDTALAALVIRGVTRAHAGNYTCFPAGLTSASVTLHVLNGECWTSVFSDGPKEECRWVERCAGHEHPAAMQHGTSTVAAAAAAAVAAATSVVAGSFQEAVFLCTALHSILLLAAHFCTRTAQQNVPASRR
ncbi:Immunoglobulin I-set [Trinorchestia longiramus]|nr:Immunoglobulin I-set [Trinorchestia longiramus]